MRKLLLSAALIATACAAPQTIRVPAPVTISEGEVRALQQIMQAEDTRQFDAVQFDQLYSSTSPLIRAHAVLAAGRIGNRSAEALLLRALQDSASAVRINAAFSLGELGDSAATVVTPLGNLAQTKDTAAAEAVHALGKIGGSAARYYVENVLKTQKSGAAVREALLAIWHFPRTPATSTLVLPFTTSPDREIRWRAVYALVRPLPDPANNARFQALARDPDDLVRSFAVRGLRAAEADTANARAASAAVLTAALQDADAHVRINAVTVLGGYRDSTYAAAASALLRDVDLNARMAAAQSLALLKGSAAADALSARVQDVAERATVRGTALGALMAVDPVRGLAAARSLSASGDWQLRMYAARSLAAGRGMDAFELARSLSSAGDPRIVGPAIASASAIAGDTLKTARALFIEKLAEKDAAVRSEALAGLGKLAQPGDEALVFDAFENALRDDVEDAALAAIDVLAKLSAKNPAIQRTFVTRFPLTRMKLPEVQRAAIRQMHLEGTCCQLSARPAEYARIVQAVLQPALNGAPLPRVRVNTEAGSFEIELLSADAPITVDNFLTLVQRKYFDGNRWHRVVPNFVLQDGDPTGTGSGGPGYAIRDEINRVRYDRGVVGMALSGPDTGGSQWFITHSPQPHLDGAYTVFGRVVSGMEVADRVIQDDRITSIELIR